MELFLAFREPLVSLKVVPKAACDAENRFRKPAMNVHGKNQPKRAKESRKRNLMPISEQFQA
jgi:hypothetical protein